MSELTQAFAGLRIRFTDRRDAMYRIRVVQELRDLAWPLLQQRVGSRVER